MRTTIDIPEDVLRRAKAAAALRGLKLKDFVTEALRAAVCGPAESVAESAPEYAGDLLEVAEGVEFPILRGGGGPELPHLTAERIHRILEEEEVERALGAELPG